MTCVVTEACIRCKYTDCLVAPVRTLWLQHSHQVLVLKGFFNGIDLERTFTDDLRPRSRRPAAANQSLA
jgi:hypothetical protein